MKLILRILPYISAVLLVATALFGAYRHGVTVMDDKWEAKWVARDEADAAASLRAGSF